MDRRDILLELSKAIARGGALKNMALPCFLWVTGQLPLPPGSADLLTQPSPPRGGEGLQRLHSPTRFPEEQKNKRHPCNAGMPLGSSQA